MDEEKTDNNLEEKAVEAPTLSKAWSVAKQHIPTFTGGKITHSKVGLRGGGEDAAALPFLLLPVGGDVAIVDAVQGITLGSLRGQASGAAAGAGTAAIISGNADDNDDEEDDDDDELDMNAITSYALSNNDQVVVTCSHNNLMRQYHLTQPSRDSSVDDEANPQTKTDKVAELVRVWGKSGHTLPVTQMEFHLSSVFLATGSVDGTVRVWDGRNPKSSFLTHLFQRPRHPDAAATVRGSVTSVAWYPDHSQLVLAIGRDDGTLAIHDLRQKDNAPVAVLSDHNAVVTACGWLPTQGLFVSASRDAVVNLWKVRGSSYQRIHTLPIYEQIEALVVLRPTETRLVPAIVTAGSKGMVRLWHIEDEKFQLWKEQTDAFGEERGGYLQMCYHQGMDASSPTGDDEMIVVADAEHNLSFLSLAKTSLLTAQRTMVGHNDDILDIKVLPRERIAVATNSSQVRLFDTKTFSCQVLNGHSATVLAVDVSPCGRYLATCGKDHQVRMWHTDTATSVAIAIGHAEAVGSVALSRKIGRYEVAGKAAKNGGGSFLLSVSVDRTLKRWNLPGSEELDRVASTEEKGAEISLHSAISVRAHEKDINIVSVAPNDSLVATGSQDKTVKIWKATDLSLVATLTGHRRGVWDCQFSPHDRILATGSGDRTIKLWSLGDFGCVRTFQGHVASVLRVRFLHGGLQMVSSGADGLLKVWTIRNNECETTMDGHSDKVWALDLAQEGKQLISGGADSKIIMWNDTTAEVEESRRAEEEEAILMDQKLANHLRHKEYGEALEISLLRDKPRHALRVFTAIIEAEVQKGKEGLEALRKHVQSWEEERLVRVLQYCRDWNTKARNCNVALLVVKSIVTTIPVHTLAATKGVPELVAGIISYAERHHDRLDRLYGNSFLLDFALSGMGDLETSDDYAKWEATSKLVLPPKQVDGRVQVGGMAIVGRPSDKDDDEVMTLGDSSSSSDSSDDSSPSGDENSSPQKSPGGAKPSAAAVSDKSESDSEGNLTANDQRLDI